MSEKNVLWLRHGVSLTDENRWLNTEPAKSLMHAAILTPNGTRLSPRAIETIRHIRYYMNGVDGFVLYSDCSGVMLRALPTDEMLAAAADCANSVADSSPVFARYTMDDGCGLLSMQTSAFCFRDYGLGGSQDISMEAQQECVDACRRQRPIAIVYNNAEDLK